MKTIKKADLFKKMGCKHITIEAQAQAPAVKTQAAKK